MNRTLWETLALAALMLAQSRGGEAGTMPARLIEEYGRRPLAFEENRGQTAGQVKFLSRGSGYDLFLTTTEAVLALRGDGPESTLRLQWVGASPNPRISGEGELAGRSHYFLGSDSSKWRTGIPSYGRVRYEEIYPGIALVFYGRERTLEYDFLLAPGTVPQAIRLAVEGADSLEIDPIGDLVLQSGSREIRLRRPVAYQEIERARREVAAGYRLLREGGRTLVGLEVAAYDPSRPLVIDPVLVYSTYLGGRGSDSGDAITVDSAGNAYVVGTTNSPDFPSTGSPVPSQAFFVTKLDPAGNLVYSAFLSGFTYSPGNLIQADAAGHAYVAGTTESPDFPLVNPLPPSQRGVSADLFILKLAPSGSSLVYSTRFGGSSSDTAGGLAIDLEGNAYVIGHTASPDLPEKNPLFSSGSSFLMKLAPSGSALVYATRLPGMIPTGIAVDLQGAVSIAGHSFGGLPVVNAFQEEPPGSTNAFVAKLTPSGSALVYSTYLGGSSEDECYGIAVDAAGSAYVTGATISPDFPLRNPFQATIPQHPAVGGLYHDTFITKLGPTGSLVYSTFLGGIGYDWGYGIAVDSTGSAYVTGYTESPDYPLKDPVDADCGPLQRPGVCTSDAFVARLSPEGNRLLFSTYLGGSSAPGIAPANDFGFGIATDHRGNVYVAGASLSLDFPLASAVQSVHGNATDPQHLFSFDAFAAKISLNNPPDCSSASASPGTLWPPNGKLIPVSIRGVTDPDGDPVTLAITSLRQDEPPGRRGPDGTGLGAPAAQLRADRTPGGDGRVYHLAFEVRDDRGGTCTGAVRVCVPHDQRPGATCGDGGALFDSTGLGR